jgi:hypothetical protein
VDIGRISERDIQRAVERVAEEKWARDEEDGDEWGEFVWRKRERERERERGRGGGGC